ncbi:protein DETOXIFICATION 33-like isoform X2 [Primulina huaijiensis]|uniref:protein DETOXIFICATION 33-like isoform X2 n=1 Tax=Primulina huaijiensis TaxID=1492673 RepID=UPI003CC718F4
MVETKETQHLLHKMEPISLEIEKWKEFDPPNDVRKMGSRIWDESKMMWEIAAPAIITSVAQFSLGFVTIAFVGHIGEVELAAVSVVQNVLEGFVFGIMFLQAQSKIWVMSIISLVVLLFHFILNWILLTKLGMGLLGAAIAENVSWWLVVLAQIGYVVCGFFPESWTGFSLSAFKSLFSFVKLSLASAIMLCLELWYYTLVILMVGWLKNPEIAVDAISICMNLEIWTLMFTLGFNAAISVRVSNELGANHPKAAKFSVIVCVVTSTVFGFIFTVAILATKNVYPLMFSDKKEVIEKTSKLGYFLAATIFLNSIQPVLHGVAVGAGWQLSVALINVGCYYLFGLPFGALLGYKFKQGVKGIWLGMLAGCLLQTIILIIYVLRANWSREAMKAEARLKSYSDSSLPQTEKTQGGMLVED